MRKGQAQGHHFQVNKTNDGTLYTQPAPYEQTKINYCIFSFFPLELLCLTFLGKVLATLCSLVRTAVAINLTTLLVVIVEMISIMLFLMKCEEHVLCCWYGTCCIWTIVPSHYELGVWWVAVVCTAQHTNNRVTRFERNVGGTFLLFFQLGERAPTSMHTSWYYTRTPNIIIDLLPNCFLVLVYSYS